MEQRVQRVFQANVQCQKIAAIEGVGTRNSRAWGWFRGSIPVATSNVRPLNNGVLKIEERRIPASSRPSPSNWYDRH
jgi:hypothetical protein